MNTASRIYRAVCSPRLLVRGINRLYHQRMNRYQENPGGVDLIKQDWDTLIILDACRHDIFKSVSTLRGTLSSRISKGSSTVEWLKANFHERDLSDTVYMTANPQLERNREEWDIRFHEILNVWLEEGWDDETGTVRAETLTEVALDAAERFPHKRLIIHYMQPHYPFVPADTDFDKKHLRRLNNRGNDPSEENVWNQKFMGDLNVSREELWSIYSDNLEYVLKYVNILLGAVPGKTVVTSDHGNYVGERASPIPIREYGHPRGMYDDPVIRVPWLELEQGERREIHAGSAGTTSGVESDVVTERLRDLGYRD